MSTNEEPRKRDNRDELRLFSAMAMQGILANKDTHTACIKVAKATNKPISYLTAKFAIDYAKALIAELNKEQQ